MTHRASEERFENRVAQVALALFSALIGVIGLSMFVGPTTRGSGLFFLLLGGFFFVRALRSSAVVVDESGVSTRSILRTRRHMFSELREVEVAMGRTGLTGFGREHLIFHRVDGEDVAFKEFSCPPPKVKSATSVVRRAAVSIGERLTQG